ncbi:hypothetical protein G6F56_004977 [Rhizopus delemar]|nr:hypothetical protein G6F56_004977 [Rhizopus delemar]
MSRLSFLKEDGKGNIYGENGDETMDVEDEKANPFAIKQLVNFDLYLEQKVNTLPERKQPEESKKFTMKLNSGSSNKPISRKKAKENVENFNQKRKFQQTIEQFVDIFSKRQKAQEVSDEYFKSYHDFEIITTNASSLENKRSRYFLGLLKEEAFERISERHNARAQQQLESAAPSSVNEESDC